MTIIYLFCSFMQGGYLSMDLTDTYQQSTVIICSYCMGMICSAAKDATKPDCDTNPSITFWLISLTEPSLPLTVLVVVVIIIIWVWRAHDCKCPESLARLKISKILIICQENPFGELSSKKIFSTFKNL